MVVVATAKTPPSSGRWRSKGRLMGWVVWTAAVAWLALWLVATAGFFSHGSATSTKQMAPVASDNHKDDAYPDGAPPVFGIHKIIQTEDRQTEIVHVWPSQKATTPNAVVLLLHGCSHSALKFFSPSADLCPTCIGLAEELQIARLLTQQEKLGVVAVTSQDRKRGCWSGADVAHVQDVLGHFQFANIPILALGASSGGAFAAQLVIREIADAALVGVMSLSDPIIRQWKNQPLVLAPMPRDKRTTAAATRNYRTLIANQGNNKPHVMLDVTTCGPLPVTATYLHRRVPHVTSLMAEQIVTALQDAGHVNVTSGYLIRDPTRSDWRMVLRDACGGEGEEDGCLAHQPLGPGISPLAKALHRAWAFHEYCSEITLPALQFFQDDLADRFPHRFLS